MFKPTQDTHEVVLANVIFQIALIDLVNNLNLVPEFVIGTSIGEISAAYFDEFITREEAIRTADLIGSLMKARNDERLKNRNGNRLSTILLKNIEDIETLKTKVEKFSSEKSEKDASKKDGLKIICINSCSSCFVSGRSRLIQEFLELNRIKDFQLVDGSNGDTDHKNVRDMVDCTPFEDAVEFTSALSKIFCKNGRRRSRSFKWITTSIPSEEWYKYNDVQPAEYLKWTLSNTVNLNQVFEYLRRIQFVLNCLLDSKASILFCRQSNQT